MTAARHHFVHSLLQLVRGKSSVPIRTPRLSSKIELLMYRTFPPAIWRKRLAATPYHRVPVRPAVEQYEGRSSIEKRQSG